MLAFLCVRQHCHVGRGFDDPDLFCIDTCHQRPQIMIFAALAAEAYLGDGRICQSSVIAVVDPADALRVLAVILRVVFDHNNRFVVVGRFCRIVKTTGAGDRVLSLGHQHGNMQIAGSDLIKAGLYDLGLGEALADLLVGQTDLSKQGNDSAEVVDIDQIIVDQIVGLLLTVVADGEGVVFTVNGSDSIVRDGGG